MNRNNGVFSFANSDGSMMTYGVEVYDTYAAMVGDTPPNRVKLGLVKETNLIYRYENNQWIIGFPNVAETRDYTAFEVFAHDYDIPAGQVCEELGGYVNYEIPANMTMLFTIRTLQLDNTKSDVVVDWGDGSFSSISKGDFLTDPTKADSSAIAADGERNYTVEHTYQSNGKYIVKVFGKQYYNIMTKTTPAERPAGTAYLYSSLICRIFTEDLPIALHIGNLTGMCESSMHLLNVDANAIKYRYFENCSQCFRYCKNLIKATGFKRAFTRSYCAQMFASCYSLEDSDAQLALDSLRAAGSSSMYADCINLTTNVSKFIPEVFGCTGPFTVSKAFYNCKKLTGTVPAAKLWNNEKLTFATTTDVFTGCPEAILNQVPQSWGGNL